MPRSRRLPNVRAKAPAAAPLAPPPPARSAARGPSPRDLWTGIALGALATLGRAAGQLPSGAAAAPVPAPPARAASAWAQVDIRNLRMGERTLLQRSGAPIPFAYGVNMPDTNACGACNGQERSVETIESMLDFIAGKMPLGWVRLVTQADRMNDTLANNPAHLAKVVQIVRNNAERRNWLTTVNLWISPTLHPKSGMPTEATEAELRALAKALRPHPYALIGPCNEPRVEKLDGDLVTNLAEAHRRMQRVVDVIREHSDNLIVMPGLIRWANDLDYFQAKPLTDPGVAQGRFPYPRIVYDRHDYNTGAGLQESMDKASKLTIPHLIGEFGAVSVCNEGYVASEDESQNYVDMARIQARLSAPQNPINAMTAWVWSADQAYGCLTGMLKATQQASCGAGSSWALSDFGQRAAALIAGQTFNTTPPDLASCRAPEPTLRPSAAPVRPAAAAATKPVPAAAPPRQGSNAPAALRPSLGLLGGALVLALLP